MSHGELDTMTHTLKVTKDLETGYTKIEWQQSCVRQSVQSVNARKHVRGTIFNTITLELTVRYEITLHRTASQPQDRVDPSLQNKIKQRSFHRRRALLA